jgi:hypothetical protein
MKRKKQLEISALVFSLLGLIGACVDDYSVAIINVLVGVVWALLAVAEGRNE